MIQKFEEFLNEGKNKYDIKHFSFSKSEKGKYYFDSDKYGLDGTIYIGYNTFGRGQGPIPFVDYIEFDSDEPEDMELFMNFIEDNLAVFY